MISKRNKFRPGDLVRHGNSDQQGIVRKVSHGWVKILVPGKHLPGGKPYLARFSASKVQLVASREAVIEYAMKVRADQAKKNNLTNRVATWIKRMWNPDTPAENAPA